MGNENVQSNNLLFDENGVATNKYKAYMKYQEEYKNAVAANHAAFLEAQSNPLKFRTWPIIGKDYSDDVDAARAKWQTLGYKKEIDEILGITN